MAAKAPDRRRNNPPSHGTTPPVFLSSSSSGAIKPKQSSRSPDEIRKIFLRTGLISSVTGSSFLEIAPLKLSVSVLGPRPLPRTSSTPFAAQAILTTEVKFAPFASTVRRGYIRDSSERDLGSRLYQALVGAIRRELYPKSRIEVVVTILDSEDEGDDVNTVYIEEGKTTVETKFWDAGRSERALGVVLAGCITAASAALADAGIEMFDLVSGGVATSFVDEVNSKGKDKGDAVSNKLYVRDPAIALPEGKTPLATCVLGYMAARDEISELWISGKVGTKNGTTEMDELVDEAIAAARSARGVLNEAAKERVQFIVDKTGTAAPSKGETTDVEMSG
ncbi:3'-5'-exoribonuclease [Orbilia oligospora]|uniref:3'-5'-exoribonuclease n=1 Tax=Orbilia oligospora TaxID=2813651 RepID=A0A7C8Q1Q8_ORBOL|nr:3'-5'-exoribonuclease [Orbilia oligospora]KAF3204835.1 3'-5'-exoribonuclease [Orbilia oligospora]